MKVFKVSLLILSVFLLSYCSINYSGFCSREGRWLSDEELFYNAAKKAYQNYSRIYMRKKFNEGKYKGQYKTFRPEGFIPYKSVEEFMVINPDCCTIEEPEEGVKPSLLDETTGHFRKFVTVRYKVIYPEGSGRETDYGRITYAMKNCGQIYSL